MKTLSKLVRGVAQSPWFRDWKPASGGPDRLLSPALFLCGVLAVSGCSSVVHRPAGVDGSLPPVVTFEFSDGGKAPYYQFTLGDKSRQDTVIFFISGSGCASVRDRFPGFFDPLKDKLNARVYVLQKRGVEVDSSGFLCSRDFTRSDWFEQIVADQRAFIEAKLRGVDPADNVVLFGASEGAIVAAKVAAMEPRITVLGLIGGGGSTLRNNLRVLSGKQIYLWSTESEFDAIAGDSENLERSAWGHSYKYWSSFLDVDIGDLLLTLNIPIVMAMGADDESVPVAEAIALQKRFSEAGRENFSLLVFPASDHRLYDSTSGLSHSAEFLNAVAGRLDGIRGAVR